MHGYRLHNLGGESGFAGHRFGISGEQSRAVYGAGRVVSLSAATAHLSDTGHLSNTDCAAFAGELLRNGTTRFVLSHLSRENNMPSLAYQTTVAALTALGARPEVDYRLQVAAPEQEGGCLVL